MKTFSEDELLARLVPSLPRGDGLVVGPGDDCAVVAGLRGKLLLLKTDAIAEGVHFLPGEDPARVGWKALCRPLSDIAAMGGEPSQALVTLFSPPSAGIAYWEKFYRGLTKAARRFGVGIAGGELTRQAAGIAVSIALTGWVSRRHCIPRSGGRPGDLLFVTGKLGGSIRGHHLDFVPRLREGAWLAAHARPSAMMDLSDGLGSDLQRMARACGCGFEIDTVALPRNRGCSVREAIGDGEDYELLFALPPRRERKLLESWPACFPKVPLTRIGRLTETCGLPAGWPAGWDHFSVASGTADGQPAGKPRARRKTQTKRP